MYKKNHWWKYQKFRKIIN